MGTAADRFIEFWREFKEDANGYNVHPDDSVITERQRTICSHKTHNDFMNDKNFHKLLSGKLHLNLLPAPYIGNLKTASIYILSLNPGFGLSDYFVEENNDVHKVILDTLYQRDFDGYPNICLNPKLLWTPGGQYWYQKLKQCMFHVLNTHKESSMLDIMKIFSCEIATIELVPYHSSQYQVPPKLYNQLTSPKQAIQFIKEYAVPRAITGDACIVALRKGEMWGLKRGEFQNIVVYEKSSSRGAHITPPKVGKEPTDFQRGGEKVIEFMNRAIWRI
ncbi:hypothetical protein [Alicyclobacillus fodiniaquatilis]|uniref:Uncharacterized protein n=1 Tax=Alicyclobacillus fodiniaquatilis TaxID=1661150 RepID=A0ABW4JEJ1_9BACL